MSSRACLRAAGFALAALLVPACADDVDSADTVSAVTVRVSTGFQDLQAPDACTEPSISADGRWVAFASASPDLTDNDSNDVIDIFVKDRISGRVENITNRSFLYVIPADCEMPSISGNGRFVAFVSAGKYVDDALWANPATLKIVYVYDREDNVFRSPVPTTPFPADNLVDPALSGSGRYLTFASAAANLGFATAGNGQVFRCDFGPNFNAPVLNLVSHAEGLPLVGANGGSVLGRLSGDGSRVSFMSGATNLAVAADAHNGADVYLWEAGAAPPVRLVSIAGPSNADRISAWPAISLDGNFVAYSHRDNTVLVSRFVRRFDVAGGTTVTVSDPTLSPGTFDPVSISGDGRYVGYVAPLGGGFAQAFRFDAVTGVNEHLSRSSFGVVGNQNSIRLVLSADGFWSAWESRSSNLVAGDTNGAADVFVRGPTSGF